MYLNYLDHLYSLNSNREKQAPARYMNQHNKTCKTAAKYQSTTQVISSWFLFVTIDSWPLYHLSWMAQSFIVNLMMRYYHARMSMKLSFEIQLDERRSAQRLRHPNEALTSRLPHKNPCLRESSSVFNFALH